MNNEKFIKYKKYIMEKLYEFTDELTGEIMEKENVTSGDIYPEQSFELENHYESISSILLEVVAQNSTEDFDE